MKNTKLLKTLHAEYEEYLDPNIDEKDAFTDLWAFENDLRGKRGRRRKQDVTKALRKKEISESVYPNRSGYYENLHQYSKNKIHCSCKLCRAKTNKQKSSWTFGKNFCISDLKKIEKMESELFEWKQENDISA